MIPSNTRGTKAINKAQKLPWFVPKTGITGEKANDNRLGVSVLVTRLVIPNEKPSTAPSFGPNTIEPIITGM